VLLSPRLLVVPRLAAEMERLRQVRKLSLKDLGGPAREDWPGTGLPDADVLIAGLLSRTGTSHAILVLGEIGASGAAWGCRRGGPAELIGKAPRGSPVIRGVPPSAPLRFTGRVCGTVTGRTFSNVWWLHGRVASAGYLEISRGVHVRLRSSGQSPSKQREVPWLRVCRYADPDLDAPAHTSREAWGPPGHSWNLCRRASPAHRLSPDACLGSLAATRDESGSEDS